MPATYTSPFAASFKSACNRGTSYNVAVQNIANRNKKSVDVVWNSLYKAGLCYRQKFNGQWIYFPCNVSKKATATVCKGTQYNCWQYFCEYCINCGFCTPEQMKNNCGSQKDFMNFCKKFWNKQFTTGTATTTRKRTTSRTTSKKSTSKSNYSFPKGRTTSRRRAA